MLQSEEPSHRIRSIEVTSGFLEDLNLSFDRGLNCIIGPRGTGKSTVQEMVRFALNVMPGRKGDPVQKRVQSLIDTNLSGGRVELTIETKDDLVYTISRSANEDPILVDSSGNTLPMSPQVAQIFRADIYSQNEIEYIAETPHYQLDLLDKFEEENLRAVRAKIGETVRALESNASAILPLADEQANLEGELIQLEGIRERLKGFSNEGGDSAPIVNQAHIKKASRDRETRIVADSASGLLSLAEEIQEIIDVIDSRGTEEIPRDLKEGPNGEIVSRIQVATRSGVGEAKNMLAKVVDLLKTTNQSVRGEIADLEKRHAAQELEFRKTLETQQQNQARSAERIKLEKQQNELLSKAGRLEEVKTLIKKHVAQREILLARLSEERDRRFEIRQKVASHLNEQLLPSIRVTVTQNADQEAFRRVLEEALRGSRIQQRSVAGSISAAISPQELGEMVRQEDQTGLQRATGINLKQAATVIKCLAPPDQLMTLEVVDSEDLPLIELCDNDVYKASSELSTGQKCTAILPILMLESANPLMIDQPEDNLDNSYVFESIVTSVRNVKTRRQLIFVTHNPNIPVLGEAELVLVMQSNGHSGAVKMCGGVDDCRDEIINLLEGGKDAFRLRGERYNG